VRNDFHHKAGRAGREGDPQLEQDSGHRARPVRRLGLDLIACQKTGRQARLIELDPKYIDTIILRWREFSGRAAVLDRDGQPFEEIAAGRETPSGPVISDQRPSWGGSSTSSASPVSP